METYVNFTIKNVFSIEKTNEPDVYWVLFDDPSDISIYGPCIVGADKKFRHAVKICGKRYDGVRYGIRMRIGFGGLAFDEFLDNVLATGRVCGVLTINEVNDVRTIYKFEITAFYEASGKDTAAVVYYLPNRGMPSPAFTINRAVEIRKAKMGNSDDNKFLIFFEKDEDGEPKIDIYSEDHDTISAINKKLKRGRLTPTYYLVAEASGKVTESHGFFTVNGYIKDNEDIVITSYEVNYKEEKKI